MTAAVMGTTPFAWGAGLDDLKARRVTQCALSRICGVCGESLGRPVAFVGTPMEVGRNTFHFPPLHTSCASQLRARADADPEWSTVLTSGFEFVRPGRDDLDRRVRFEPNSLL